MILLAAVCVWPCTVAYVRPLWTKSPTSDVPWFAYEVDGKVGFSFDARAWPHGFTGSAKAHGAVFTR